MNAQAYRNIHPKPLLDLSLIILLRSTHADAGKMQKVHAPKYFKVYNCLLFSFPYLHPGPCLCFLLAQNYANVWECQMNSKTIQCQNAVTDSDQGSAKTCSFQATANTSRHHDLTHCETSGEQTSEQQSHDCLQWFCVTMMETGVSAADIAGEKFIGKSRIFSLGATIEAELHKLTTKKMTIAKITRDSSLLWIQVSLPKWQEKDWRADKKYLSFSRRRKNVPCLPLWLKHSLELVLYLSVGALRSSSYERSSARVVKLLLIFFHFCQILLLIYFGNSI